MSDVGRVPEGETVTSLVKRGPIVPMSLELLNTYTIDYDAPTRRPSPLREAEMDLAEAEDELAYTEDRVERARAEVERVRLVPGSDVKPPPGPSLNESLRSMLTRPRDA